MFVHFVMKQVFLKMFVFLHLEGIHLGSVFAPGLILQCGVCSTGVSCSITGEG